MNVSITQPGYSSSPGRPLSVSTSFSLSPSYPLSELAISLKLCLTATILWGNTFQVLLCSIGLFQQSPYLPAPTESMPLYLQLTFLPQRFLSQHYAQVIPLSLHRKCSKFVIRSPPQMFLSIASRTMPPQLALCLCPGSSSLDSLPDIVRWTTVLFGHICQPELRNCSFSMDWPSYFTLTLLLGRMIDVAGYEQYEGKLNLICQGLYIYSSWKSKSLL